MYPQKRSCAGQGGDQGENEHVAEDCPCAPYPRTLFPMEGSEHTVLWLVFVSGNLASHRVQLGGTAQCFFLPKSQRKPSQIP